MPSSSSSTVAKCGLGWTELPSVGEKRKSMEEEEHLNLIQHIQPSLISSRIGGCDSSLNPLDDRHCDWSSPVHWSQLDAATLPEYEKCLDLKTGRLYMVKRSNSTSRRSEWNPSLISSSPFPSFGDGTQGQDGVSLDLNLGLHLGSNTSVLSNDNNNRKKRCNASPTHSTISFQEEQVKENEGGGVPLYRKKGNCNSHSNSNRNRNSPFLASSPSSSSSSISCLVTVGCPKCLIFLMVSHEDPSCPCCGTSTLLHL